MHFLLALLQNAAFLLALVLIYEVLSTSRRRSTPTLLKQVLSGLAIAGIACVIMLTPIEYTPGILLDTRSVLISLGGLFFGPIPALVAMFIASAFRLYLGGIAAWTGVWTILGTGLLGLAWRRYRRGPRERITPAELYLFGVVVHLAMVGLMVTLPVGTRLTVFSDFAAPILLIFPIATLLLGMLLAEGVRGRTTEKELQQKKQHLMLALSASNQTLFDADLRTGEITFDLGPAAAQNHLRTHHSIEQWFDDLHPDDREEIVAVYQAMLEGSLAQCQVTYRERTLHDGWAWISLAGHVVKVDGSGAPARVMGTFTDITESRESEQRLTMFRNLLDHSLDGFEVVDASTGRLIDVNSATCCELDYTREELLARRIFDIEANVSETSFDELVSDLRKKGSLSWEGMHRRKDGSSYPVEVKLNLVSLDRDYIVAAVRNVSERKAMEQSLLDETHRRQNLIEQSRDGIVTLDAFGNVFEANRKFAEMLGYTREEVHELSIWEWEKYLSKEAVLSVIGSVDEAGDHFETRYTRKDGTVIDVEISTNAATINGQKLIFCVCRDITERKQIQASLQLAALVYQNSREAMMVTDADCNIVAINPAFTEITGYSLHEVLGKNPRILQSGQHGREFFDGLWAELREKGHWSGEILNKRKNGEIFPESLSINAVYDESGGVQSWVAQFSDITEKKGAEQLIWEQANFDSLTGLPNRRMFQDRLGRAIKKSKRSGLSLALLFLDLDNFKEVNDTLGHDMGDRLLQQTAARLKGCVRETDIIARLGGDEFTIVVSDLKDAEHVGTIAQKILRKLSEPFALDNEVAYVSASIGITLYPTDASDAEGLLKSADQAMYGAKEEGRNCYRYFTVAMQEAVNTRMRLANDLREAITSEELYVVYQPIVNLTSGRIHKAEALVRWNHRSEGLVNPSLFVKIAEECGLIGSIGRMVLDDAISRCKYWRTIVPDMQISINKSPAEFDAYGREGQADPAITLIRERDLPGNSIVIEITEGMLLSAKPEILKQLLALRDAGVEVALDDFGTGYSSLSYLRKFDIDYLKIDQTFINNLGQTNEDLALCEAIVTMAHRLGLKVVAEGVETKEQAALLKGIGCDYAQGYLFAPALPADELEQLLSETRRPALGVA
jgi:diguanylate cyclase (GGDEF)-like protein/PAS domain S-box-containing protein